MNRRHQRAVEIGTKAFVETEVSAEETVLLGLDCIKTLLEQRRAARLRPETGADALVHLGRGVALATEAFAEFSKAHPILRTILSTLYEGDGQDFGTTPTETAALFKANVRPLQVA